MITVRFPNGQAVQYNDATYCMHSVNAGGIYHKLYTQKNGDIRAIVTGPCIIEFHQPCRVYNALDDMPADMHTRLRKMDAKLSRALRKP